MENGLDAGPFRLGIDTRFHEGTFQDGITQAPVIEQFNQLGGIAHRDVGDGHAGEFGAARLHRELPGAELHRGVALAQNRQPVFGRPDLVREIDQRLKVVLHAADSIGDSPGRQVTKCQGCGNPQASRGCASLEQPRGLR